MIIVVLPFINSFNDSVISVSDSISKAEVGSSRINIFGFLRIALAIAILCLCPPDNFNPFSPTFVLYFSGRFSIYSWMFASFAAFSISF